MAFKSNIFAIVCYKIKHLKILMTHANIEKQFITITYTILFLSVLVQAFLYIFSDCEIRVSFCVFM